MRRDLIEAILWIALGTCFVLLLKDKTDVQIYWSTSKDACERIEINGENVGCSELSKYEVYLTDKIWVK